MSTTFAIDDGSAVQGEGPAVEDDSIVYSRYSAMALQSHRPPTPRRSRRNKGLQGSHRSPVSVVPGDDAQTAARCREALRWITTLPEGTVRVQVNAGQATLEGTVRRENERNAATVTVSQVEGVAGVDNRIHVQ